MVIQFIKVKNISYFISVLLRSNLFLCIGRKIILCLDDMLKSKKNYGEDADEFKPFRFLNKNSPATKVERSYIIFGGGKHACPGYLFYFYEQYILSNITYN
jgi:hypothetical protein